MLKRFFYIFVAGINSSVDTDITGKVLKKFQNFPLKNIF
jgi:hypothetical protein